MTRKVFYVMALAGSLIGGFGSRQSTAAAQVVNVYVDNRSSADAVVMSLMNAINRKEYSRAYSYWDPNSQQLTVFPQFVQGYLTTASVQAFTGSVTSDSGAGQTYFSVPVTLVATTTTGPIQTYVGCYVLHLANPGIQGVPPFQPIQITSAKVQQVANDANTAAMMTTACLDQNGGQAPQLTPTQTPDPSAIDATRYIDDRSDSVAVLRSLFNAVNRQEYVRAYSYWQAGAPQLAAFPDFQQGYLDTRSVQLIAGVVTIDQGAGQIVYRVPVVLVSQLSNSSVQTFVGCYTLRLATPTIQAPPFQPLGIYAGVIGQVANTANPGALMPQTCQ